MSYNSSPSLWNVQADGLAVPPSLLPHKSRSRWPCPARRPAVSDRGGPLEMVAQIVRCGNHHLFQKCLQKCKPLCPRKPPGKSPSFTFYPRYSSKSGDNETSRPRTRTSRATCLYLAYSMPNLWNHEPIGADKATTIAKGEWSSALVTTIAGANSS